MQCGEVRERPPALERREQSRAVVGERAAQVIRAGLGKAARDDPEHGEGRRSEQADEATRPELEQARPEHRERDPERNRTTTVGAEPVVGHDEEAEDAEQREAEDTETASREERACEERREQQRLDLVADA